ncbi:NOP56, partial [Cordylochernes scorpioides]
MQHYLLFVNYSGFSLFRLKEFDSIAALSKEVQANIKDYSTFKTIMNLEAFQPFTGSTHCVAYHQAMMEGKMNTELQTFLEKNLPSNVVLCLENRKLAVIIKETFKISVLTTGICLELYDGICKHFPKFVPKLNKEDRLKLKLGAVHLITRTTLRFNPNSNDNLLIQNIGILDQLDKTINTWAMRLREWYSTHFPELYPIVPDNYKFSKLVTVIKDRKTLDGSKLEEIMEIVEDEDKAKQIIEAAKTSMGVDMVDLDLYQQEHFAQKVTSLMEYRKHSAGYLKDKMNTIAPSLAALVGEAVGARLIARAGSLTKLAKCPGSTIQVLGAEKALFRAIKSKGNTPKYGLLYNSTFISKANFKNKGRISRFLANKCAIASRIDSLSGQFLRDQVEERLKFLEGGPIPRKNEEVMLEALMKEEEELAKAKAAKKEKKKKKRETSDMLNEEETAEEEMPKKKKKKSHQAEEEEEEVQEEVVEDDVPKKKKKKKKSAHTSEEEVTEAEPEPEVEPKKKHKKNKAMNGNCTQEEETMEPAVGELVKKKKKKKSQAS